MTREPKSCGICGKSFVPRHRGISFCSDQCRKARAPAVYRFICPDGRYYVGAVMDARKRGDKEDCDYCFLDNVHGWFNGDIFYQFCICKSCGAVGFKFEGRSDRIVCGCSKHGDRGHSYDHPKILKAFTAARSARFEAGE